MSSIRPNAGDYGRPRILVAAADDARFAHLAWPKLARAADGTLILAYSAGVSHYAKGSPAVSISTDNGETFTGPHVLFECDDGRPFYHCGNLAVGVAGDGAVLLLAMAMNKDESRNTILGWRSGDCGRTWQPTDTSALAGNVGSVYGRIFEAPARGLAVLGHSRPGAALFEQGLWLALSCDHGRSWEEAQVINREALVEPACCYSEGRLVCLARENAALCYRQLQSDDLGETWRASASGIGWAHGMPSPFVAVSPRDSGTLYAISTDRARGEEAGHEEMKRTGKQGEMLLWSAALDKLEWQREGVIAFFPPMASCPDADYGYPWMIPLDHETWMLVYYCGVRAGPCAIWGMRLHL